MYFCRLPLRLVAVPLGILALHSVLSAQTSRGAVTGLITDPQKADVPNAKVTLIGLATNVSRVTRTNESGLYRFDAVDSGAYKLTVEAVGFHTAVTPPLLVAAAQETTADLALELGDLRQVVEVSESSEALRVETAVRGGTVERRSLLELPYASRNPVELGLTLPGVSTSKFATPSATFVVNGARGRSNNFMIDGTDNNDISIAGQAFPIRNPGAIEEVSVQTNNYDAEFGRSGGAVVNLITRGGGNNVHGEAGFTLDSTRDDAISSSLARDPAIRARGHNLPGTEQQFDGSLGGPIRRDRTFFFLSYFEGRQFSTSTTDMQSPTAAGRATLLSLFPTGRNANADLLQKITAGYDGNTQLTKIPLGDGRPDIEFGHIITPYSQSSRTRQYGARIDHRLAEADTLSGRFLIDDQLSPRGGENQSFPSFATSSTQVTTSISLYHTHVFSPTVTNELRPGYTRSNVEAPLDAANPLAKTLPQIVISGINTGNSSVYGIRSTFPQGRLFNNYMLQDTMSVIRGTHTLRFGIDLMDQRARQAAPINERGLLTYGASSNGNYSSLANFLDDFGGAGSASRSFGNPNYYPSLVRQAYFFQDRWRASASLTLTLGIRYENFGLPMNVVFNPVFTGLFNVNPVTLDSPFFHRNQVEADNNNWGPSVGLAYSAAPESGWMKRLLGYRKTVFRMGYGLGYDSYFNNITSNIATSAPSTLSSIITSTVDASTPRGLPGLSKALPRTAPSYDTFLSQTSVYHDLRNPYYQRWSGGIQREISHGLLLDVAYVGTKGTRLYTTEDLNPLVTPELRAPVPANVATTKRDVRVDPLQGSRTVRTNGGSSTYHSAQFELTRRFGAGFSLTAAYTFSKLIDNSSEIFIFGNSSSLPGTGVPSRFGGLQQDRGVGFFDRPQRLVWSYVYELPFLKAQHGVVGHLGGGWQISGITTYESGVPYTVVNGQDADGLGGASYDRPNYNPSGQRGARAVPNASSPTGYINPDANGAPIDPQQARYIGIAANNGIRRTPSGNLGRNTERGPGLKNWDMNFVKNTKVNEHLTVQFRAEFYNIWNTPMYGKVSVSPFAPSQSTQTIPASVFTSLAGQFLNETIQDGGGRVIRWQLRMRF